jgi:hypothetical protein
MSPVLARCDQETGQGSGREPFGRTPLSSGGGVKVNIESSNASVGL